MKARAWLVVFRKEFRDALRDRRSLFSASTFCWLGPLLVGVLWKTTNSARSIASALLIITAFTGAMNIANDTMAGERERGSLEPLLMNPVTASDLVLGKFLATCAFSLGCVILTLLCALAVLYVTPLGGRMYPGSLLDVRGRDTLVPPAAACRSVDLHVCANSERRHPYLSVALLAPMLIGILAEFFPSGSRPP